MPLGKSTSPTTSESVIQDLFRTLVEQIKDYAIFVVDRDGRNVSWNEGVKHILGYKEDEFLGQEARRIYTPEDIARGVPAQQLAEAAAKGHVNHDRWMVRSDGNRFWATGITTSLWDASGRPIGFAQVLTDQTARRRTEDALRESEERLRIALAAARMGTWRWAMATGTQTFDESSSQLLGLAAGELMRGADDFVRHVHPDDRELVTSAINRSLREGADFNVDFRVALPGGQSRWLRGQGQVLCDQGGRPEYMTGALLDITERRQAEERMRQVQRVDAVGKLAGGVAHEVNNMMTAVLGFSDFLLHGLDPGDRRRGDIEQIRKAASRAAMVTGQLLAFSRRALLQLQVLDLNAVVAGMEPMLRRLLGEDKRLVICRAPALGCAKADQGQLEQVLVNLALNARDAMPGAGRLTISTANVLLDDNYSGRHSGVAIRPGPYAMLAVSDTGHGMDAETRARVFEPFFTTKPMGQGTGLGLATVYGIVKQSDGLIWVYSEPGQGTTFKIYLPRVDDVAEVTAAGMTPSVAGGTETVLVAEDEEMVRKFTCRLLRERGYNCLEAKDGIEALRIARGHAGSIGLLITDVVMPEMGGKELAGRLAKTHPGTPVLFMTGYTDDEVVRRGLLQPDAPLLQKPFAAETLARRVRDIIDAAQLQTRT